MVVLQETFELGSMVYDPFLGVCTVMNSSEETVMGIRQVFCELKPRENAATIKVPASQMRARGIRPLLTPEQIENALGERESATLGEPGQETYSQRLRRWTTQLRSSEELSGYHFLREWHQLTASGVRLTAKETQMCENVQRVVVQEIAQVLQISTARAGTHLNQGLDAPEPDPAKKKKKA